MQTLAFVFSLVLVALGIVGVVSPAVILRFARWFARPYGLMTAATVRIIMGVAFFLAAPESRAPAAIRIVGLFIILAGVVTPFFGAGRSQQVITWWSGQGLLFQRAWSGIALLFGLLLAYAVAP
ncbi:MAG TPA: hypothetical protein PLG17_03660 [Thermodesulfobacteriota bacterium]|nr:hypothetical protein [Deltaproteobacteria bacterium]HNR13621.1 hypothetical protein [Thermodesulfobacteriota bacterium]HNU71087.1 hypothetical protein [Thermodesulfobacteriota bacterium]HOC38230.1 hypothetical protein [Thermodesulfobacteriota bacterium]HQO77588.1 hypothetical protein [Thermodesulfobacteriota bacterium]